MEARRRVLRYVRPLPRRIRGNRRRRAEQAGQATGRGRRESVGRGPLARERARRSARAPGGLERLVRCAREGARSKSMSDAQGAADVPRETEPIAPPPDVKRPAPASTVADLLPGFVEEWEKSEPALSTGL